MRKRIISLITVILIVMSSFAVPVSASEKYQTKADSYTWTAWSTTVPPSWAEYETKTQYSYRDKSFVTNGYLNYSGYTRSGTTLVSTEYGGWYRGALNESDTQGATYRTIVKNETANAYFSYAGVCDCKSWYWKTQTGSHKNGKCKTKNVLKVYTAKRLPNTGYKYDGECYEAPVKIGPNNPGKFGTVYLVLLNEERIGTFVSNANVTCLWQGGGDDTRTMYRTVTNKYQYTHWKWGNWTSYSDTYVTSSANREVQTRTLYRYKAYNQTIDCPDVMDKVYGEDGFNLNATAITSLSYSSSNPEIAAVSDDGYVTIKKAGSVVITIQAAAYEQYAAATKKVTLNISKISPQLLYGGKLKRTIGYNAKGFSVAAIALNDVVYSSSNKAVLTVSPDGWVTMKKPGAATITIKTPSSDKYFVESKKIKVTVTKGVQNINCNVKNTVYKNYGAKAFNLGAKSKGKRTYTTSNKNIATVNAKGLVTLKNPGTVTITIKAAATAKYKAATKKIRINVALKAPTLKVEAIGGRKVSLTIGNTPGATGYEIYVKEPDESDYQLKSKIVKDGSKYKLYGKTTDDWKYIKNLDSRTVKNARLKEGKAYSYKVKAYRTVKGKNKYSNFSSIGTATVI